jgi:hypothetical protein
MRTFRDAISSIGNLLMVMQPWNDPVSMKRAWYVLVYLSVIIPRLLLRRRVALPPLADPCIGV